MHGPILMVSSLLDSSNLRTPEIKNIEKCTKTCFLILFKIYIDIVGGTLLFGTMNRYKVCGVYSFKIIVFW